MPLIACLTKVNVPEGIRNYILSKKELHIKNGLDESAAERQAITDFKNETVNNLADLHKQVGNNKFEKNAVQEPSTSSLLQHTQETIGETGGERKRMEPGIEGNEPPTEGEGKTTNKEEIRPTYIQRPPTSLNYMGTGKLETEFGVNERPETEVKHDINTIKEADNLLEKGWTVKGLLNKIEEGDAHISDAEYVNLTRYGAELSDRLRSLKNNPNSPEYNKTLAELNRVANAANLSGQSQGRALGIRGRFKTVADGTYADYMLTEMAANNDAPLTESQKELANKQYTEFEKAKAKFDEDRAKFEEEVSKFNAEKEFNKTKKPVQKTSEEKVKLANDKIKKGIEGAREALKKLRSGESGLSAVPLPGVRELIAIAPHVKIALEGLVEKGAIKLSDAVKELYENFKEFGVSEKNIHDIIAGEYNEKKITRKEAAIRKEDLRIEAQLINKLESLVKGEEPKNEKAKIKRNQEIEGLRNRIKDFRKEEAEAGKFYGESDAAEKRIQAKEDELQILKDRKEKETKETEKKEISAKEQKLNDEIKSERKKIAAEEKEANSFYKEPKNPQQSALENLKRRNEKETEKIKEKIANNDFAIEEKKTPLLDDKEAQKKFPDSFKAAQKSRDELIKAKHDITIRRLKQMYENKTPQEKAVEVFSKTLNIPRTLMASMDVSAPLRQAVIATTAHPILANQALKFMFKAAVDGKVYNRWLDDVHSSPRWDVAEKTKLAITDPESLHVREHEEAFQGAPYAEKIPVIGKGVAASERAYVGYLNKLRWDLFNMYADRFEEQGKTYENNKKLYEGLSSFINSATGRGGMKGLESASPILNWVLFASKLIASRINMLGLSDIPNLALRGVTLGKYGFDYGFYSKLPPELRIEAAKDMAKFVAVGVSTLLIAKGLSNATGGNIEVETDPRSSDFGKIKSGETRWDIWGGFQPYARVLTQVLAGQRKASTTGKVYELDGKGFMGENRLTPLSNFARGKLAPIPSTVINLASGRDATGQPVSVGSQLLSNVTPLIINDVYSAMKDQGVKALYTVGIPSAFGVGVQTYQPKEAKPTNSAPKPIPAKKPHPPKPR